MNPGNYNRLCTVLIPEESRLPAGGVETRLVPSFQFWASKDERGSRRFRAAGIELAEVSCVFETHYEPRLKAGQQFTDDAGQRYQIAQPPRELGLRESTLFGATTLSS